MTITEPELGAFVVSLLRVSAVIATAPVIGDAGVPVRAKLVMAVAVAFAVAANRPGVSFAEMPPVAILELAVGVVTGTTARFVIARVAVAGQLIGLALGLGFASEFDPRAGENAGLVRTLATTLASLAFVMTGGLEEIVRSVARPAEASSLVALVPELLRQGTAAFGHGLALAAPLVFAALVGNIGIAVMNRAAPALNVFSVALAAVLLVGGAVMLATSSTFVGGATDAARQAAHALTP